MKQANRNGGLLCDCPECVLHTLDDGLACALTARGLIDLVEIDRDRRLEVGCVEQELGHVADIPATLTPQSSP